MLSVLNRILVDAYGAAPLQGLSLAFWPVPAISPTPSRGTVHIDWAYVWRRSLSSRIHLTMSLVLTAGNSDRRESMARAASRRRRRCAQARSASLTVRLRSPAGTFSSTAQVSSSIITLIRLLMRTYCCVACGYRCAFLVFLSPVAVGDSVAADENSRAGPSISRFGSTANQHRAALQPRAHTAQPRARLCT